VTKGNADTPKGNNGHALTAILSRWHPLTREDRASLAEISAQEYRVSSGTDFIHRDDPVRDLPILQDGWAAQYRVMHDGRRFVLKLSLPGEVIDGCFPLREPAQYSAEALTDVTLLLYPSDSLFHLVNENPRIAVAFFSLETYQHSFLRNRVMALAGLNAYERLGHLCLELLTRLEILGMAENDTFNLPVKQETLGELLGMHGVHINRMFRRLGADGFIARNKKTIQVKDREGLAQLVEFRKADIVEPSAIHTPSKYS